LASYNLALMAKNGQGSPADPDAANSWFHKAAKFKLIEAYNAILAGAIKPAGNQRIAIIETPEEWILAQNPNYYTLQLASSTRKKLIEKYYGQNDLRGKAGYYKNRRQGEDWYALIYGAYPSVSEANAAIQTLPKDLRKWSPWVRRMKDIQRLIK
jgi:septal ring-binding cell division protein DamX